MTYVTEGGANFYATTTHGFLFAHSFARLSTDRFRARSVTTEPNRNVYATGTINSFIYLCHHLGRSSGSFISLHCWFHFAYVTVGEEFKFIDPQIYDPFMGSFLLPPACSPVWHPFCGSIQLKIHFPPAPGPIWRNILIFHSLTWCWFVFNHSRVRLCSVRLSLSTAPHLQLGMGNRFIHYPKSNVHEFNSIFFAAAFKPHHHRHTSIRRHPVSRSTQSRSDFQ